MAAQPDYNDTESSDLPTLKSGGHHGIRNLATEMVNCRSWAHQGTVGGNFKVSGRSQLARLVTDVIYTLSIYYVIYIFIYVIYMLFDVAVPNSDSGPKACRKRPDPVPSDQQLGRQPNPQEWHLDIDRETGGFKRWGDGDRHGITGTTGTTAQRFKLCLMFHQVFFFACWVYCCSDQIWCRTYVSTFQHVVQDTVANHAR